MIWQDILISIASLVFSLSLVPQVYEGFRTKKGLVTRATSVPTFIGLYAISIAYFTLSLYFSSMLTFTAGTLWLLLFIQRITYEKDD